MAKRIGWTVLAVVLAALLLGWMFQRQVGEALFERAVAQNLTRHTARDLPDGLHVGLCGTGSPLPNLERAGPCNIVVAGDRLFVVDIGEGGGETLGLMGFNAGDVRALFLTHFHSDHIDGLGPLQLFHWTRGAARTALPVYGPAGVEAVVEGFNAAYAADKTYRIAHHGEVVAPPTGSGGTAMPFELPASSAVVYDEGGLVVTAFRVDHSPVEPAVGYRFDYRGRAACISGDTVRSSNLEAVCKGVDLVLHEALQTTLVGKMGDAMGERGNANAAQIFADIMDYHTTPTQAAQSAAASRAKMLVLTHLVPPLPSAILYPAFLEDADQHYDGPIIVGEDGMLFSLPAGSSEIERSLQL